jgi:hypothetical protein
MPNNDGPIDLAAFVESLEKPFYEPIGRYVFRFGLLERKVDEALSVLMGIDFFQTGVFVLSEIDFLARAKLLNAYCRDTELLARMNEAIKDIEEQNTFRNALVHGPWMVHFTNYEKGHGAWQKVGLSRRHNLRATDITVAKILANEGKINEIITKITQISQSVVASRVGSQKIGD